MRTENYVYSGEFGQVVLYMEQMLVAEIMKEWAYFWNFVEAAAQDRPDLEIFQYLIAHVAVE